ncbi:MAG: tRNA (adenosine(37)-N6)-dimethylallyltransferase MiaA [Desulfobacterales bacterium]|jgi:tRNA dimethylallyltransferase|nr:tRNA (adenosine(37)-N6)-dimethylallyltransferase MiaA [Desulfobacterales bacterium]
MTHHTLFKQKIIIIVGPTAVGKTRTAIDLALTFSGEIINADAMQIYRRMNIGSAKPTFEETTQIPHHGIDIIDPDEPFDAARFEQSARHDIDALLQRGVLPFVVGGTGLYIRALLYGLCDAISASPELRANLQAEADQKGTAALYDRLSTVDPESAAKIHPNDKIRIIRALEVFLLTGTRLSRHHQAHQFKQSAFDFLKIGLHLDRETLYDRINRRTDAMISAGLEAEVRSLLASGYASSLNAMQSIGYRHVVDFLEGRLDWQEAVRTMKRDTRRYAKRQMTWFMKEPDICWKRPDEIAAMRDLIRAFIHQ